MSDQLYIGRGGDNCWAKRMDEIKKLADMDISNSAIVQGYQNLKELMLLKQTIKRLTNCGNSQLLMLPETNGVTSRRYRLLMYHSRNLYLVNYEGQPFVAMHPFIEGMGLDWSSQYTKINKDLEPAL